MTRGGFAINDYRWTHAVASKRTARNRDAVVRRARAWSLEDTRFSILPQELITMIYRKVDVIREQAANVIARATLRYQRRKYAAMVYRHDIYP